MRRTYTKHQLAVVEVVFDFTKELALLGDTPNWYAVLTNGGITTDVTSAVAGIYKMLVGGGNSGVAYNFGMQLLTNDGVVAVDLRQMRVRGVEIEGQFDANAGGSDQFLDGGSDSDPDGGFIDGGA